jgi:hypothetical protein
MNQFATGKVLLRIGVEDCEEDVVLLEDVLLLEPNTLVDDVSLEEE